jgi:hypothetical protein
VGHGMSDQLLNKVSELLNIGVGIWVVLRRSGGHERSG